MMVRHTPRGRSPLFLAHMIDKSRSNGVQHAPSIGRRLNLVLLASLALVLVGLAQAQPLTRIVVLPFDAPSAAEPYRLGLATGLQRTLNVIDNVYVPPVGDALLLTQRLSRLERLSAANVAEAYGASTVVSGRVAVDQGQVTVRLGFAGPDFPQIEERSVRGAAEQPEQILSQVVNAVISQLGLSMRGENRAQVDSLLRQVPSLPSLKAVGDASLRLPSAPLSELIAAAELDPDSSWVLSEKARALVLRGERGRALEFSEQAVAAEPVDIEALVVHGNLLLAAENTQTALETFDRALDVNPSHALALLGRGNALADRSERISSVEAAIESYPRLSDAYLDLAAMQAQESGARALQTLRRGAERIPDSISLRRAVMQQALNLGDAAGALHYLRQELPRDEAHSPALFALALELPLSEFAQEARAILREGREHFPDSATLASALAQLEAQTGEPQEAEAILKAAVSAHPDNLDLVNQLAIIQAQQGAFDEARATLEAVAEHDEVLQINLAQVYLQAGQSGAAANVLEPLVESHPDDAELQAYYGVALGRTGAFEEARRALERALALDPELSFAQRALNEIDQQAELTRGQQVEELGPEASRAFEAGRSALIDEDLAAAAAEFQRALELQDSGLVAFYHGYALQRAGQPRSAIASYLRALENLPESDIVLNNLGFAYVQVGRYDLALDTLHRAREANPNNVDVHLNLGLTYYALDRFGRAVDSFEEALRLNPELEAHIGEALNEARSRAAN